MAEVTKVVPAKTNHNNTAPEPFPTEGMVRAKQSAKYLSIGLSTFWLYVKKGRIKPASKLGPRVSAWKASYIRDLAENGIEEPTGTEVSQ